MSRFSGDLATYDLSDVVRSLFLERATGVLEVNVESGKRRLFFVDGELHLPPSNPMAREITQRLAAGASDAELEEWMGRVATVIDGWREGSFQFDPGRAAVPPDAVGPLPTPDLVMAAAVIDRDEGALLSRLGGESVRWVSCLTAAGAKVAAAGRSGNLAPAESALHELLSEPRSVGEMLAEARDRQRLLVRLCRLAAVGLIERWEPKAPNDGLLDAEVLKRFADRVAGELEQRPIPLEPAAHRARLAELLGRLGEMNHYELLGVAVDSTVDQVHAAYGELARLVHPSHAVRLGLKGREQAVALLFEKATEAYLVLADPERRARYNREAVIFSTPLQTPAEGPRRSPELAAKLFAQAKEMAAREEFHYAHELLRQAVQCDRRPEYFALMAEVQRKNPKWTHHALDSLREAVNLSPDQLPNRRALAELYEEVGDRGRARAVYRSILIRVPGDQDAVQALERLEGARKKRRSGFFGLFGGDTR